MVEGGRDAEELVMGVGNGDELVYICFGDGVGVQLGS
jgi:hypothetical protein